MIRYLHESTRTTTLCPYTSLFRSPSLNACFETAPGGADSHPAIMARSMGIPAVLGVPAVSARLRSGVRLIVDGEAGRIVVDPDPETLAEYRRKAQARERLQRQLARLRALPAVTGDGVRIAILANLELPRDLDTAHHGGAEIGRAQV